MSKVVYLTRSGLEDLKAKYKDYVENKRLEASEKIKVAREYGDLSENAEYDAAKEEQAMIEAEIKAMEEQLNNYEIIDDESNKDRNKVYIGATVTIQDGKQEYTYRIVGATEANILAEVQSISNESPMGKALLGKSLGQEVQVFAPKGVRTVKVVKIDNL